mmetsp:Transcript_10186/g.35299  ORF Transcript_10186/g.35299 Transcript_10186/m.35299 type:complete len:506 (-) Transcript_10186:1-1518(-)
MSPARPGLNCAGVAVPPRRQPSRRRSCARPFSFPRGARRACGAIPSRLPRVGIARFPPPQSFSPSLPFGVGGLVDRRPQRRALLDHVRVVLLPLLLLVDGRHSRALHVSKHRVQRLLRPNLAVAERQQHRRDEVDGEAVSEDGLDEGSDDLEVDPGHERFREVSLAPAHDARVEALDVGGELGALCVASLDARLVVFKLADRKALVLGSGSVRLHKVHKGRRLKVRAPSHERARGLVTLEQRHRPQRLVAVDEDFGARAGHRGRARGRAGRRAGDGAAGERRVVCDPVRLLGLWHGDEERRQVLGLNQSDLGDDVGREHLVERDGGQVRAAVALLARQRAQLLRLVGERRRQLLELVFNRADALLQAGDELRQWSAVRVLGVLPRKRRQVALHGDGVDEQRLARGHGVAGDLGVLALDLAHGGLDGGVDLLHVVGEGHERVEGADGQGRDLHQRPLGHVVRRGAQALKRRVRGRALVRHRQHPELARRRHGETGGARGPQKATPI